MRVYSVGPNHAHGGIYCVAGSRTWWYIAWGMITHMVVYSMRRIMHMIVYSVGPIYTHGGIKCGAQSSHGGI